MQNRREDPTTPRLRRTWLRDEMNAFLMAHPFSVRKLAFIIGVSRPTLSIFLSKDDKRADMNTLYLIEQFLKNHVHGEDGDEYKPCNYIGQYGKRSGGQDNGKQSSAV